jgi:hypothetical protein
MIVYICGRPALNVFASVVVMTVYIIYRVVITSIGMIVDK